MNGILEDDAGVAHSIEMVPQENGSVLWHIKPDPGVPVTFLIPVVASRPVTATVSPAEMAVIDEKVERMVAMVEQPPEPPEPPKKKKNSTKGKKKGLTHDEVLTTVRSFRTIHAQTLVTMLFQKHGKPYSADGFTQAFHALLKKGLITSTGTGKKRMLYAL